MPPKPKFTKDEVVNAALGIVRAQGEAALTARALAEALGSSARPIFPLFSGMEEVKEALYEPAFDAFYRYCDGFKDFIPRFKKLGVTLVSFATSEPHLFEFLFIGRRSQTRTLDEWCSSRIADEAIRVVEEDYGLDHEVAVAFFKEMWIHVFALCVLKVTNAAELTDAQVSDSLSRAFLGLLALARSGHLNDEGVRPVVAGHAAAPDVSPPEF